MLFNQTLSFVLFFTDLILVIQLQFQNKIQEKISKTCSEALKDSRLVLKIPHQIQLHEMNDYLVVQKNVEVLFPTVVLFLEQDPLTNIAMNLNVNF